jgi:hypothetical protein
VSRLFDRLRFARRASHYAYRTIEPIQTGRCSSTIDRTTGGGHRPDDNHSVISRSYSSLLAFLP